ncbi:hypothetical protein [Salinivibrio kushneri]|uniref:hypothetical protein n=1 Tax=Salinivibrio kushneri TaxID=1908198 RepID=UPI000C835947|nr:hypothetical protein [Salinivibrio kushneri]
MTLVTLESRGEQLTFANLEKVIKQVKKSKTVDITMPKNVIDIHLSTAVKTKRDLFFFWNEILKESLLELKDEEKEKIETYIKDNPISEKTIRALSNVIHQKSQRDKGKTSRFLANTKEKLYDEKLKNYDFNSLCDEDRKTNWLWCYIRKNANKKVRHLRYKKNIKGKPTKQIILKNLELDDSYLEDLPQNKVEGKRIQIERCLIFSPYSEEGEKMVSNHLKDEWRTNIDKNEMIKWLDGCHHSQLIWAYEYIQKREGIKYTWTPSSNEDIKSVLVAFYDLTPEDEKKDFINKFRRAWSAKKNRVKNKRKYYR